MLDCFKLKEFADDNFKFDENGRKLSKQEENTVGKGEIARYEQFFFSHSVFKRLVSQGCQKVLLCGNGLIRVTLSRRFFFQTLWEKKVTMLSFLPKNKFNFFFIHIKFVVLECFQFRQA